MKYISFFMCCMLGAYALLDDAQQQDALKQEIEEAHTMLSNPPMHAVSDAMLIAALLPANERATVKNASLPRTAAHPRSVAAQQAAMASVAADSLPAILAVSSGNDARPESAALGEAIVLRVRHLGTLLNRSARERSPLVLYVDGIALKGVGPSAVVPENDEISFTLLSTGPARMLWDKYLQVRGRDHFFMQDVLVTVGLENGSLIAELPPEAPDFSLVLIRRPIFYFSAVLALFLFAVFLIVAYESDLLRDSGADPASGRKPFSLSRTQMALWFFIAVVSFLLLWVETGRIDTMPVSVVMMLGISAATALGAAVIDSNVKRGAPPEQSHDFLMDIISDEHGVCFHRFQMAGWTIVLAVVFVYTVFSEMRMPDFDASILLLMGISSGTYLGYKIPERVRLAAAHT